MTTAETDRIVHWVEVDVDRTTGKQVRRTLCGAPPFNGPTRNAAPPPNACLVCRDLWMRRRA